MAKYERKLRGNFNEIVTLCDRAILEGSSSASYEDGSSYELGGARVCVRVYERYSAFGGNRVSLNLTILGAGEDVFLSAITAGGSQAMFFKINTVGEEAFLDTLESALEKRFPSR